jgi:hypothetical protein
MSSMLHSSLCALRALLLWKTTRPLRFDPVVGGARKFQRFQQGKHHPIRQPSINRSIDCPYTWSFNFHPDATHLAGVPGSWEDWVRGKKATVRNRDTSLERIEKSLSIYNCTVQREQACNRPKATQIAKLSMAPNREDLASNNRQKQT